MPSTLFTAPPDWQWLIVLYFFVGGLAGGCYFLGALVDFFGRSADRPLARLAYGVAFVMTLASGVLLILDLTKPQRFWHMLIQSERGMPMFKPWSPMSLGSWALLIFGLFAFVSFLASLAEADRIRGPALAALRPPRVPGAIFTTVGGLLGFFVAGYTGVLLAVTNRPIWSDTNLLGLAFVVSAASTSAAFLLLLAWRRRTLSPGLRALERFDAWVLILELVVLVALVASLGSLARLWLNAWGVLFGLGVVGLGIVVPLILQWWRGPRAGFGVPAAAALVLLGGFLLRIVIVFSSESL